MAFWRTILFAATGICVFACACALGRWIEQAQSMRSGRRNTGMVRLFWLGTPLIFLLKPMLTWRMRQRLRAWLDQAGHDDVTSEALAAWMLICALIASVGGLAVLVFLVPSVSLAGIGMVTGAAAVASVLMPCLGLKRRARQRRRQVLTDLPFLLDMTTLCIEAGLNIVGALEQAAACMPAGVMHQALVGALAEMRAGVPRIAALEHMATRLDIAPVQSLVGTLAQAQTLGMSVGPLLQTLAHTQRNATLMRAEQLAQKAPVKLLFPLMTCIFPCTFIVLGFPLVVQMSAWSN